MFRVDYRYRDFAGDLTKIINNLTVFQVNQNINYYCPINADISSILTVPSLRWLYFYYSDWTNAPFPAPTVENFHTQYLVFDRSTAPMKVLPANFVNYKKLSRLYLRRNAYTTLEVNALAQQIADLLDLGMGSANTNTIYVYLNQTGTGKNAPLTVAPVGWTQQNGYVVKGKWRIYHNK